MALDQIWKQQLTLVTYGNKFLAGELNFNQWIEHPIFNQHSLTFRDLLSQHLLAQHFQIWLEGLKKQGVTKLSLHLSTLLNDEQNPNVNVELLPFAHFIVSHQANKKTAWICGYELAQWDHNDHAFEPPITQHINLRQEIFWGYKLNNKLAQKVKADLQAVHWNDISKLMQRELFDSQYTQDFSESEQQDLPFYGYEIDLTQISKPSLALLPTDDCANCAYRLLHRSQALTVHLEAKRRHPYDDEGELISPEEQILLRNFAQKNDDLFAKLIVNTANHYQTAHTTTEPEIIDHTMETSKHFNQAQPHKVGSASVIKLIIFTVILCICAYYFGL